MINLQIRVIISLVSFLNKLIIADYQAGKEMEWIIEKDKIVSVNQFQEIITRIDFSFIQKDVIKVTDFFVSNDFYGLGMDDLTMKAFVAFLREKEYQVVANDFYVGRWLHQNYNKVKDVLLTTEYKNAEAS